MHPLAYAALAAVILTLIVPGILRRYPALKDEPERFYDE